MTIAACYVSPEGVVLGADSTSTFTFSGPQSGNPSEHHLNFGQKIFEIGENATLGVTTWGLASLPSVSYRTMLARFADSLSQDKAASVGDAAWRWSVFFWQEYSPAIASVRLRLEELKAKEGRTEADDEAIRQLRHSAFCGFCLGGHVGASRHPEAFEITFNLDQNVPEPPKPLPTGTARFWGWPNLIDRLVWGTDDAVYQAILATGKWTGTQKELVDALLANRLVQPENLPLREAIDWVHASIYTTIKAMKFSHFAPYCGGPIEIAVISTDRRFRWVKHKKFSAAL